MLDALKNRESPEELRLKAFDASCSKDALGRIYEIRGDFAKACEARVKFPDRVACGSLKVGLLEIHICLFIVNSSAKKMTGEKVTDLKVCSANSQILTLKLTGC